MRARTRSRDITRAAATAALLTLLAAQPGCIPISDTKDEPPDIPLVAPPDAELLAQRPYALDIPRSYVAGTPTPLVLLLHGHGGSAAGIEAYYHFLPLMESAGFLYVRPEGAPNGTGARAWNWSAAQSYPFDVAYVRAVIDDIKVKHTVDPRRVFVIGFSAGAHMTHRIGCALASRVAAIVSVAGQVLKRPEDCAASEPVSVLQVHGDADEVIGYEGDLGDPPSPVIPSARETVGVWARNDGCTGSLTATGERFDLLPDLAADETRAEQTTGCPSGIDVALWTMEGAGHHPAVGASWASRLYGFASAHPRP